MSTMKRRHPKKQSVSNAQKGLSVYSMNKFRRGKEGKTKSPSLFILIMTMILVFVCMCYSFITKVDLGRNNHNPLEGLRQDEDIQNYSDDMSTGEMWEALDCERIFESDRPAHSQQVWINARALYEGIIRDDHSSIQVQHKSRKFKNYIYDDTRNDNGFSVPVEAKQAPPKGRGIFAVNDIKAGTLIWSTKETVRFDSGSSYREFNFGLEVGVACDVLQWAYVQDVSQRDVDEDDEKDHEHERELRVSVDLDEGCFCNDGGGEDEGPNMGCDEDAAEPYEMSGGCKEHYFALRDIKAGEELLCSYGQFAISSGWKHFGLA